MSHRMARKFSNRSIFVGAVSFTVLLLASVTTAVFLKRRKHQESFGESAFDVILDCLDLSQFDDMNNGVGYTYKRSIGYLGEILRAGDFAVIYRDARLDENMTPVVYNIQNGTSSFHYGLSKVGYYGNAGAEALYTEIMRFVGEGFSPFYENFGDKKDQVPHYERIEDMPGFTDGHYTFHFAPYPGKALYQIYIGRLEWYEAGDAEKLRIIPIRHGN